MTDHRLRRAAMGCLLLGFEGTEPPGWLLRALGDGLGGVVLFASNTAGDLRALTDRLRDAADRAVVVAIDEEGGDVTRLDATTGSAFPGAAALGYHDDERATESCYRAIGARLARAGITLDLAPVADLNSDPRNPVIGTRSFGTQAAPVARHVAAAVRGIQASGIGACAKHFPGHGATTVDSHEAIPTVSATRELLDARELVPFRAAIGAGVRAVMTGHLAVPALDPDRLATTSPRVMRLLRDELGFGGAVLTDALEMGALGGAPGMCRHALAALAAGSDTIETGRVERPGFLDEWVAAVEGAVCAGDIGRDRLAQAAWRTAGLATAGVPVGDGRFPDIDPVEIVGTLPSLVNPTIVECRQPESGGVGRAAAAFDGLLAGTPGSWWAGAPIPELTSKQVIVVVRDAGRHPEQLDLVRALQGRAEVVVLDVGWPAPLIDGVPTVRTRGVAPRLLRRAAQLLAGQVS